MKKLFLICFGASLVSLQSMGQLDKPNVSVLLKEQAAFQQLKVDTSGLIFLESLPDTMLLVFNQSDFLSYNFLINKGDSAACTLSFNCPDKECVQLYIEDVHEGKIKVIFKAGELTGIGGRLIAATRRKVILDKDGKHPYMQIVKVKPDNPSKQPEPAKPDIFATLTPGPLSKQIILDPGAGVDEGQFYYSRVLCPTYDENVQDALQIVRSRFNIKFKKPSTNSYDWSSNAVTPKYRIIYDLRPGGSHQHLITYLKYKNGKEYEYYKVRKDIRPRAFKEMMITVIGSKDSTYLIDSSSVPLYMDQQSAFVGAISALANPAPAAAGKEGNAGNDKGNAVSFTGRPGPGLTRLSDSALQNLLFTYHKDATPVVKIKLLNKIGYLSDSMTAGALKDKEYYSVYGQLADNIVAVNLEIFNQKEDGAQLEKLLTLKNKDIDSLERLIAKKPSIASSEAAQVESLKTAIADMKAKIEKAGKTGDSLQDALDCAQASLNSIGEAKLLKSKLLGLERALENFNRDFDAGRLYRDDYGDALLCLKLNINSVFHIGAPDRAEDLTKLLTGIASTTVGCAFFTDFRNLIVQISGEYDKAVGKFAPYAIFNRQIKIPNADRFSLDLHTGHGHDPNFPHTFDVSGGLKIDFSTGLFFNSISGNNFILGKHSFLYKETANTVLPNGNIDTVYTGRILDTSGNFIQNNKSKLSYSVGFLAHVYPRTGSFVNVGLATGLSLNSNDNGPINIMAGISVMLGDGNSRVSITGGWIWGQHKTLSSEARPYILRNNIPADNHLYNSVYEVPLFYNGSNDIPTYTTWKRSCFLGISYDFASLSVRK